MDYIPTKELALSVWAANFATLIAAAPTTFGLMVSDATAITASQVAYTTALTLASNPGTKTKATVADKDAKKAAMLVTLRHYAQVLKRNLALSNETKTALGLNVPDTTHTPVPAPSTAPVLTVTRIEPLRHTLRYADAASPDHRGKPAGAERLQLFKFVGTTPPTAPEQATFVGDVTRQPHLIAQASADAGKTAYYVSRWATRTGLTGPYSAVTAAPIIG